MTQYSTLSQEVNNCRGNSSDNIIKIRITVPQYFGDVVKTDSSLKLKNKNTITKTTAAATTKCFQALWFIFITQHLGHWGKRHAKC